MAEAMTFGDALKILNIQDYEQRIFNSNSNGELFHLLQYFDLAQYMKDNQIDPKPFRRLFEDIVKIAEKEWERPESVFQHIETIFLDIIQKRGN